MKEILESQHEDKEMGNVLQQVKEEEILEEEEVVGNLEEVEQEVDFKLENTSTPSDVVGIDEPPSLCYRIDDNEDRAQPPTHGLSNEGCIEEVGEQGIEIEKAFQLVEIVKEEHKGMTLAKPLETSLPKSPSNTTFKWVKFLSLVFTFPLEYSLLEMDGQLRALCGVKSKRELASGWKCQSRFLMVENSKSRCNGWYSPQLNGSRKMF
ncbi:hypothetical protein Ahy_B04g072433 [Arachis hypogaea]|uniref:Uncharacterized protein n=1 Tax=Arachis hypogaea TaxID=3818 RepID=A0A444ZMZ7_ARAHY|nr:hypothetical protein Ahy_B04g072433 [Arachis hypogaea]